MKEDVFIPDHSGPPVFAPESATRRVLVCGGRDYRDTQHVCAVLDALHALTPIHFIIHGNARGADSEAAYWAKTRMVQEIACPAEWSKHGKRAGPIRNQNMLGHNPSLVVAFPGGAGTRDMVKRARLAGKNVVEVHPIQNPPKPDDGGAADQLGSSGMTQND
jgi:hypothetical protein